MIFIIKRSYFLKNLFKGSTSNSSNRLRVMYTNTQNINTNELIVLYYGNTVTLKGSQIIVNGQPGLELPYKINDLLVRQATTVLVSVEGKDLFNKNHVLLFLYFFLSN